MGGQTQDGEGPIQPSTASDTAVVSDSSALEVARPARSAEP